MNILNAKLTYNYKPNVHEFNKFINEIDVYNKSNDDSFFILMNKDTARYLILDSDTYSNYADIERTYLSYRGLKIAIADWLETGEVKIVHEV